MGSGKFDTTKSASQKSKSLHATNAKPRSLLSRSNNTTPTTKTSVTSTPSTLPSKKAEGKRKIVAVVDDEPVPAKKSKLTKATKEDKMPKEQEKTVTQSQQVKVTKTEKPSTSTKASKAKERVPSPVASDVEAQSGSEGFAEEDVHVFDFSTDDDDSSDEEMEEAPAGIDLQKLPTVAKDDAVVKQKLEKAKKKPSGDRGVIYLGRVPHGFYEDQMKSYFTQFGDVTRLRLSRNKKTGRSKHYAFIEFESSSVAQIVAETMDNYLLMGHILICKVIPKDKVHSDLWIGANRKWRAVPGSRVARVKHNKPRTEEEQEKAEKRLLKRQAERKRKLAESGIDYNFDAVAYKMAPRPQDD